MKKVISTVTLALYLAGCSTSGGFYSKNDPSNSDFSVGNTLLSVIAVAGAVAVAKEGGGNGFAESGFAWDYQPGNGQWVCRDKSNGQYAYADNCYGLPYVDNWP
jgi:hypothetical protein